MGADGKVQLEFSSSTQECSRTVSDAVLKKEVLALIEERTSLCGDVDDDLKAKVFADTVSVSRIIDEDPDEDGGLEARLKVGHEFLVKKADVIESAIKAAKENKKKNKQGWPRLQGIAGMKLAELRAELSERNMCTRSVFPRHKDSLKERLA